MTRVFQVREGLGAGRRPEPRPTPVATRPVEHRAFQPLERGPVWRALLVLLLASGTAAAGTVTPEWDLPASPAGDARACEDTLAPNPCYDLIMPEYRSPTPLATHLKLKVASDIAEYRSRITDWMWGQESLPTRPPDIVRIGVPCPISLPPTNLSRCDRYTTVMASPAGDFTGINYFFLPASNVKDRLVLVAQGHSDDLDAAGLGDMIRALVAAGFPVLSTWMPQCGENRSPQG